MEKNTEDIDPVTQELQLLVKRVKDFGSKDWTRRSPLEVYSLEPIWPLGRKRQRTRLRRESTWPAHLNIDVWWWMYVDVEQPRKR